jgi:hypothetical protein
MQRHWLTRAATIRKLWLAFIVVVAVTVVAELFLAHESHFGVDGTFAFHAWFGFVSCIVMIAVAKLLGILLRRPDTYYEEGE